jgi:hypothetical protein
VKEGRLAQFTLFPKFDKAIGHVFFSFCRISMEESKRKAAADPSTPFGAQNAPNYAQDDSLLVERSFRAELIIAPR